MAARPHYGDGMSTGTGRPAAPGLVTVTSAHSADETISRLEAAVREQGLTIFARIDHRANAWGVGLDQPPAYVLIFGAPKGGTPVMLAAPLIALDLPLRALVWADAAGAVWVSYHDPAALAETYGVPAELAGNLRGIVTLVEAAGRP